MNSKTMSKVHSPPGGQTNRSQDVTTFSIVPNKRHRKRCEIDKKTENIRMYEKEINNQSINLCSVIFADLMFHFDKKFLGISTNVSS